MQVNKKWKEGMKIAQKGFEAHGMENTKKNHRPMEDNNI